MDSIKVKIINDSGFDLPAYETPLSAGWMFMPALTRRWFWRLFRER